MSNIINNEEMTLLREKVSDELAKCKEQNKLFKQNNLYPEYSMDDVIEILEDQLISINKALGIEDVDYSELYNAENPDVITLAEDLIAIEKDLQEETDGINEMLNYSGAMIDENLELVDILIDNITGKTINNMVDNFVKEIGLSEEDIENEEQEID